MTLKRTLGVITMLSLFLAVVIAQTYQPPVVVVPRVDLATVEQTGVDAWRQIVVDGRVYTVWGRTGRDGKSVDWDPNRQPKITRPKVIPSFEVNGVKADELDGKMPKLIASDPETKKIALAQLAKVEAETKAKAAENVRPCPNPAPEPEKTPAKIPHPLRNAETDVRDYVLYAVAAAIGIAAVMVITFGVYILASRSPPTS